MPIISPINSEEDEKKKKKKDDEEEDDIENYDSASPVCGNQDDFNKAFSIALRHYFNERYDNMSVWALLSAIIWLIFFIWAVVLALRVPAGTDRVEHVFFAILFSPLYVIAHYLSAIVSEKESGKSSAVFGFGGSCGCSS